MDFVINKVLSFDTQEIRVKGFKTNKNEVYLTGTFWRYKGTVKLTTNGYGNTVKMITGSYENGIFKEDKNEICTNLPIDNAFFELKKIYGFYINSLAS